MTERRWTSGPWTAGAAIAAAAFVLVAVLQVTIPARAALETDRPARYGWQMYSTVSPAPEAWVIDRSGRRTGVDVLAYMADPRAEIRWAAPLAERLCDEPGTVEVLVRERGVEERFPCD